MNLIHSWSCRGAAGGVALALAVAVFPLLSDPSDAATSDGFRGTKTVTREFWNGDANQTVDSRKVTVAVDHTVNLRGRERINIAWSGAHPTGGRSVNPYGEAGLRQEYPVVILQCRGREGKGLAPETCWTSTRQQRSITNVFDDSDAVWRRDKYASSADQGQLSGMTPFPTSATCPGLVQFDGGPSTHLTPFISAKKKTYVACDGNHMPPEAAVDSGFPPAEVAAFTGANGKGSVEFEVRSEAENESLGCSQKVDCSIVVIPIEGISCKDTDSNCRQKGVYEPGESYVGERGFDIAVSPYYWWSASNWRNRITVPISFAPPPNVCDILDHRAPVGFYGSELMTQAGLQWAPAYCLDAKRFKFQANKLPDDAAFALMEQGQAAAAFVSGTRENTGSSPVGYAPTAVTAFAVGYVVDKPSNTGEFSNLRLNARLLAKLLTSSYAARLAGRQHPGMENNPLRLNQDPEFQALNPGLTEDYETEAAATLMSLSISSDVLNALTDYIARDPEAKDFLAGHADPWGMVVNPSYKDIKVPTNEWPLNDTWKLPSNDECVKANTTPYFTQVSAPVNNLRTIAEAVLDGWPLVQTRADGVPDPTSESGTLCKYGRIDRQDIGHRFMLGIVSLGDAARLGLRTASLQTSAKNSGAKFTSASGRTFVAPSTTSMARALTVAKLGKNHQGFTVDGSKFPTDAYPGTMVVYTAAKLQGLGSSDAKNVAMFIRTATTEGQRSGSANGQLPEGYLPLVKTGVTAALWKEAQSVADLVAQQKAAADSSKSDKGSSSDKSGSKKSSSSAPASTSPDASGSGDKDTTDEAVKSTFIETQPTAAPSSSIAALLLPLLLLGAAVGGLAAPLVRMMIASSEAADE